METPYIDVATNKSGHNEYSIHGLTEEQAQAIIASLNGIKHSNPGMLSEKLTRGYVNMTAKGSSEGTGPVAPQGKAGSSFYKPLS